MATSQVGGGVTPRSYEGLRPALASNEMATSQVGRGVTPRSYEGLRPALAINEMATSQVGRGVTPRSYEGLRPGLASNEMATSQVGRGVTLWSYEGLRPGLASNEMATSQVGRGVTLWSYEGLRPALVSKLSMALSSLGLGRFPCSTLSVRAATSVAPKFSTLKPLGDRVLIKLKIAEEKTTGGILLPSTAQKRPEGGEVVALGDAKIIGKTKVPLSVQPGANIVYSKWSGTEIEFNGVNHLLVKEDDILGVLDTDDIKDLKPLNDRVLIKVAEAEDKTAGGVLLAESAKEKPSIGTIIAVGPGAYDEEGKRKPMSVTPGNTVLYSKFAGNEFRSADRSEYVTLRVSDVLAVLS